MHTQLEFGLKDVLTHIIDDMANAISERQGEGKQQQLVRARVAATMIGELRPSNVLQVMLAGHCVMFHAVMTDSIRDTLRGELETMRHATRSNVVAMNKSFHMNLDRLDRYQMHAGVEQVEAAALQPNDSIQTAAPEAKAEPAAPEVTPAPAPVVPQSRVPIGAAQPRRPQEPVSAQNNEKPSQGSGTVPALAGGAVTPAPSASISSPT